MKVILKIKIEDKRLIFASANNIIKIAAGEQIEFKTKIEYVEWVEVTVVGKANYTINPMGVLQADDCTRDKIYKNAVFIADVIYTKTGVSIHDAVNRCMGNFEFCAETSSEEFDLQKAKKELSDTIDGSLIIAQLAFGYNQSEHDERYKNCKAWHCWVCAQRASDVLVKYKKMFDVLEFFYESNGVFDAKSLIIDAVNVNANYDAARCDKLREMRNRIVHPNAKKGSINLMDYSGVHEIIDNCKMLEDIVKYKLGI